MPRSSCQMQLDGEPQWRTTVENHRIGATTVTWLPPLARDLDAWTREIPHRMLRCRRLRALSRDHLNRFWPVTYGRPGSGGCCVLMWPSGLDNWRNLWNTCSGHQPPFLVPHHETPHAANCNAILRPLLTTMEVRGCEPGKKTETGLSLFPCVKPKLTAL